MTTKCPNCSAPLTGIETICPECGYSPLGVWPPPPDTVPAPVAKRTWRERGPYVGGIVTGLAIIFGCIFLTGIVDAWWLFLLGIVTAAILGSALRERSPEFGRGLRMSPLYFVGLIVVLLLGALATCFVGLIVSRLHSP